MAELAPEQGHKLNMAWDVNTAIAVVVLLALMFLFLVSRGFRGFTIGGGS
jgi:hypothetical protein